MFKKITWDVVLLYGSLLVLGLVAIIVVAVNHNNPTLGDSTPVLALGCGLITASVVGALHFLFSKEEGGTKASQPAEREVK